MRLAGRILYWVLTIPYALAITFFAIAISYSIVNFIRGGVHWVKGWLIHIQTEGRLESWREDDWTWPHILRPVFLYAALGIVLWTARRLVRRLFQNDIRAGKSTL